MRMRKRIFAGVRSFAVLTVLLLAGLNIGHASAQNASSPPRTAAQLEQLVAPIALYPDPLLAQVLMASTYPLEVVAAARWSQANPGVTGQALEDAMQKQPWDPSVKALTAVPQTLQMMNDKLDWTQELGDAFLAQQANVLDAVQRLRGRADAAGHLKTTEHQTVTKTAAPSRTGRQSSAPPNVSAAPGSVSAAPATYYTIASTNPDEYYVPIYDPGVVYGAWPYPEVSARLLSRHRARICRCRRCGGGNLGRHQLGKPQRQHQRQPVQSLQSHQHRERKLDPQRGASRGGAVSRPGQLFDDLSGTQQYRCGYG
jgi:hypothetical protein